jgi:hypothetical protein
MMNCIRNLVYRLGFNPKPGSIFFSPSRAFDKASEKLMEAFWEAYRKTIKE